MLKKDSLIKTSRFVVRTAFFVNRLFAAAVLLGLVLSQLFYSQIATWLLQQKFRHLCEIRHHRMPSDDACGSRFACSDRQAFDRLTADHRYRACRRSIHFRQLSPVENDWLVSSGVATPRYPRGHYCETLSEHGDGNTRFCFSAAGWMAVLMVFVLSRVFIVGTAMRNELEGTI